MALRAIVTVFLAVTVLLLAQAVLAGPFISVPDSINETAGDVEIAGDDKSGLISSTVGSWLNMGWIGIFGLFGYAFYRIGRRELTRGRRP